MILVDANVLMYAAGAPHKHKQPSVAFLAKVARGEVDACADVEVLQEILHRYRAIGRWGDGLRVYDLARQVLTSWIDVGVDTLDATRDLLATHPGLSARDALHAAVYFQTGAKAFCTYDKDFKQVAGLTFVTPDTFV